MISNHKKKQHLIKKTNVAWIFVDSFAVKFRANINKNE